MSTLLDMLLSTRAADAAAEPQHQSCSFLNLDEMRDVDDCAGLAGSEHIEFITIEPFQWTPEQRKARAELEEAMAAGGLRGLPSAFGTLDD
jgi:hypothetical protein